MADPTFEQTDPSCNAMDYKAHAQTYTMFVGLTKWGIITCVVILALMAWFLT